MLDGMTNIKASEVLKELKYYTEDLPHYSPDEVAEALETAIKDLEQQPTDAVSRSELQKTMDSLPLFRFVNNDHEEADDYYNCESVDMVIRNLPSVTPQRPKGKWIEVEVRNVYATLKCSVCGRVIEPIFDFCKYSYEDIKRSYPYCHCGAEMSGGGEDEVSN